MAQKNILKYIILGLLNHKELAGYDLKKLFESEVSDFWSSNHSQIYPELRRMEEKGLITSHSETVGTKLEKKILPHHPGRAGNPFRLDARTPEQLCPQPR